MKAKSKKEARGLKAFLLKGFFCAAAGIAMALTGTLILFFTLNKSDL